MGTNRRVRLCQGLLSTMLVLSLCLVLERAALVSAAVPPSPLPLISRGVPAFASAACHPARNANDADYGTRWKSCAVPAWLAYDLSSVATARRGQVVLAWYNDPVTAQYDHTLINSPGYSIPGAYTIEANAAAGGGSAPTSGWVTLVTVTGNTYHSRQHLINLTGYNWVRLNATASDGTSGNKDIVLNMDVHDAGQGVQDSWIFYGDALTQFGLDHNPRGVGTFSQLINASIAKHFPVQEDGGTTYMTSSDGARHINTWLSLFPGQYVALSYGLHEANSAAPRAVNANAFYDNYVTMVEAVLAAGKTPIVPKVSWARTTNVQANAPLLNARLDALYAAYPQIIRGPDFWTYFQNNQQMVSSDNLHLTPEGLVAYRQLWVDQMLTAVYRVGTTGATAPTTIMTVSTDPLGSVDRTSVSASKTDATLTSPARMTARATSPLTRGVVPAGGAADPIIMLPPEVRASARGRDEPRRDPAVM